ncbi:DNA-binding protein [Streptomyces erythrochromogenes]|uniref:DNA-binding protein n=1 Tax=Streptomyces erythrochromogenes TaxID=285574 RepID=UPI00367EFED4
MRVIEQDPAGIRVPVLKLQGVPMVPQFMDVRGTAQYLNMSVQWVYREAPRAGLAVYRFGAGRNAKMQFKVSEVHAWVKQQKVDVA